MHSGSIGTAGASTRARCRTASATATATSGPKTTSTKVLPSTKGLYKDGKKHGQGILTYKNGEVYEGSFENDAK